MSDLERACNHLEIEAEQVAKHHEEDGHIVLLVDYGIGGVKRHWLPLADLEPEPAPEVYECEGCGREFSSPQGLATHQRFCDALADEEE